MIEPTESEDLAELDRFFDAMIAIRAEIDRVASGEWPADDNPLAHAPHTAVDVTRRRLEARVPARAGRVPGRRRCGTDKYWPPVGRIDSVYGDRNVMCTLPADRGLRRLRRPPAAQPPGVRPSVRTSRCAKSQRRRRACSRSR